MSDGRIGGECLVVTGLLLNIRWQNLMPTGKGA